MQVPKYIPLASAELRQAISIEAEEFERAYRWIEDHMPFSFQEEIDHKTRMLVARHLLSFKIQDHFAQILLPQMTLVLCTDAPDADLKILKRFTQQAIRSYRTFVSKEPP